MPAPSTRAGQAGDDGRLGQQMGARGRPGVPREACTMPMESSTVTNCSPPRLEVALGAAEGGQDQRAGAGDGSASG